MREASLGFWGGQEEVPHLLLSHTHRIVLTGQRKVAWLTGSQETRQEEEVGNCTEEQSTGAGIFCCQNSTRMKSEKSLGHVERNSAVIPESLDFPLLMMLYLGCSVSGLHSMC